MSEGIVNSKPNLSPDSSAPHAKSKVPFSYHLAGTYRFGELQPHFVAEVVNNDKFPLRSAHEVRSFNLKSPLLSDVQLKKAYFQVANEAILPLNWDKVFTNPVNGDDVVAEQVNSVIEDFPVWLNSILDIFKTRRSLTNFDPNDNSTIYPALTAVLKNIVSLEYFLSNGSLFESLGLHIHSLYTGDYKSFDAYFDSVIQKVLSTVSGSVTLLPFQVNFGGQTNFSISVDRFLTKHSNNVISISYFLDKIRDGFDWKIVGSTPSAGFISLVKDLVDVFLGNTDTGVEIYAFPVSGEVPHFPLNYQRLASYQLVCRHFFSNDKIDYVYSAELYRQLVYSAYKRVENEGNTQPFADATFVYNGISYRYDFLSGYNLQQMVNEMSSVTDDDAIDSMSDVLRLLFGFNRSLRFLDYFTGAKAHPLAVGDINAPVVGNVVSAIDITKSISMQRFANFVNRVGRKFEEYTSKLGGHYVAPDWHNPSFLGATTDVIVGSETENNSVNPEAPNQPAQSVISNLRSNANKFAFEFVSDRPSVIIGITWFDIPRYYSDVIERQNFHVDRYDMFNEFMQNIGDQPIYRAELTPRATSLAEVFGYALRHIEYKTRVNQAFGGFTNGSLPSWEFIADESADVSAIGSISPDYIRSRPSELDPLFLSLTGWSRGTYWHFIIDNYNDCDPVRPMVYAPEIL